MSFLESGEDTEGGSDQIIGIVEQMKETMEADLKEAEGTEAESKSSFETLMTSKTSEIGAAGKAIETKTARVGSVAVEIVQSQADLQSTEKSVAENIDFKANLAKTCATKQKEWDERQKTRKEEIEAISDTIEMLNSDDALELFKKTLPSAASSFIQTASGTRMQTRRAKALIQSAMASDRAHSVNRHLMLLALKSGVHGFEKVVGMVDGMVGVLEEEQVKDDKTDVWCLGELDKAKDDIKASEVAITELEAAVDQQRDTIATTDSEIAELKAGLVELDKSVAEATEQRKKEHAESVDTAAANGAAVQLLGMAKKQNEQVL
jgi:chromosome segregation ATPase